MIKLLFVLVAVSSTSAFAGECVMSVKRTACPGKETEMLKPYKGQNPTEAKKTAADADACKKMSEKEAKIVRKGTLAMKEVTGKFDGKDVGVFSDKAECK